ncbi:hypothetical protein GXM_01767 [Nostoc sphaeroides CCNUC1]|uniref:Uncharacterized protein n=1 Tax=Nostoc sphaeroides CCNUC1 TaxID=2653204 RepID=A0A5P8VVA2_9NOSO|nr:hypothetical protein GXM_01767 [Nostoc sphaeroides CCNUC1]
MLIGINLSNDEWNLRNLGAHKQSPLLKNRYDRKVDKT